MTGSIGDQTEKWQTEKWQVENKEFHFSACHFSIGWALEPETEKRRRAVRLSRALRRIDDASRQAEASEVEFQSELQDALCERICQM